MPCLYLSFAPSDLNAALCFGDLFRQWNMDLLPVEETFSREAIEASDALVVIVSRQAMSSDQVRAEVAWALQAQKLILPIMIETTSLLSLPFFIDAPNMDYAKDGVTVLSRIASALGYVPSEPLIAPQLPPRSNDAQPVEAQFQLDDESAAALFFTATELAESEIEKAIFLYDCILRLAPDYGDGQLITFMKGEQNRLKPIWLQHMTEHVFDAVNVAHLEHAGQIVREMQLLDASAPATVEADHRLLQVRLELLNRQMQQVMAKREWDEIEALIQDVVRLGMQQAETAQPQADQMVMGLLEEIVDAAISKKLWERAERIIQEISGLYSQRSEALNLKFREAQIGWQAMLGREATKDEQWQIVERFIIELSIPEPEELPILREARLKGLVAIAWELVEKQQLERADALVLRLQAIEPDNQRSAVILKQILGARIAPFLATARAALSSGQWNEAMDAAQQALRLAPEHVEAAQLYQTGLDHILCDSLYGQAVLAADTDHMQALGILMQRIAQTCLDYGDPQGILRGQTLNATFAGFVGEVARLEAHPTSIRALAISNDGTFMVTGAQDSALVWDLPSYEPLMSFKAGDFVKNVVLSPDNLRLAILNMKGEIRIWSLDDGKLIFQDRPGANEIVFSPDGQLLAAGTLSGHVVFWDTAKWLPITNWDEADAKINALAFSPDGRRLAVATEDRTVMLYDTEGLGEKPKNDAPQWGGNRRLRVIEWLAQALVFLKDGEQLLGVSGTSLLAAEDARIWNMRGEVIASIHARNYSNPVIAVSPDESLLVIGERMGGAVEFWDLKTTNRVNSLKIIPGYRIGRLAFTMDGMFLVVGDAQGNVTFWGVGGADKPAVHKGKRG